MRTIEERVVDKDVDDNKINAAHQAGKDKLKRFKFGLSAYGGRGLLPSELELSGAADAKYYNAEGEELKTHKEKGTWAVVPLPEGVKQKSGGDSRKRAEVGSQSM